MILLSLGKTSNFADITKVAELSWEDLAARFSRTPSEHADKAALGWYCPAKFEPAYRDSENFVARYALTFDYDHIDQWDLTEIKSTYAPYRYVMYTTASHTPEKPRVRIIFPLSRPATMDEFSAVTRKHAARFDIEKLAGESNVPAQMMFLPTVKPGKAAEFWSLINEGAVLDVNTVLGEYDDWTDRSSWPRRTTGDSVHHTAETVTPPNEKPGVVGDFCRSFRIPDAIERFQLPYVPGSEGRYTYTAGSRPDGLRLYDDDTKAHSEHDTDPARGQTNAFDLVRLHRFGSLDKPEHLELPIAERPSYKAMVAFALEQPEVRTEILSAEFEDLGPLEPQTVAAAEGESTSLARPLSDMLSNPTIPRWLLRDKLERAVIALMAGPRGSYKSFIALDWVMCVAAVLKLPVYVVSGEGGDFDRRARAWLTIYAPDVTPSDIPLYVVERRIDLNSKENIELIRADCQKLGIKPVLFMLDTFSKLSGGLDENSNTEVKAFIGRLDNGLKRAYDATVLLVSHTGHADKGRARGASALEADTDAAYIVQRNDSLKLVGVSRQRFKASPELEPLYLRPEVVQLGYKDGDGVDVTSLVMRPAAPPNGDAEDALTPKQRDALKVVMHALSGTADGKLATDVLVDAIAQGLVRVPGKRDTRKQQAAKTLESLIKKSSLTLINGMVSTTTAEAFEWE